MAELSFIWGNTLIAGFFMRDFLVCDAYLMFDLNVMKRIYNWRDKLEDKKHKLKKISEIGLVTRSMAAISASQETLNVKFLYNTSKD
ncbi:hypothetical protein BpHYR1_021527 [Brachionus plicatilis]|uniref:Uncharacterized protein n=1 Tax=Brachionus plicatilis TaxID=10195 RepID=A0A3M7SFV9_BRAPC|nr:hypothetical protein BpHYR1_021527 [Brachionus plicatilis]